MWLTPDIPGSGSRCRVIRFADSDQYERILYGLIAELIEPYNWVEFGTETIESVTSRFLDTLDAFTEVELCMPIGSIVAMASDVVPYGYLFCDGTTVKILDYPALYVVIEDAWGSAPPGEFRLPDLRAKMLLGEGQLPDSTGVVVGDSGGEQKVALTVDEMPEHNHTTQPHSHGYIPAVASITTVGLEPPEATAIPGIAATDPANVSVNSSGGGNAHENMPPYATVYYVIKYM